MILLDRHAGDKRPHRICTAFITKPTDQTLLESHWLSGIAPLGKTWKAIYRSGKKRTFTKSLERELKQTSLIDQVEMLQNPEQQALHQVTQHAPHPARDGANGENYYLDNKGTECPRCKVRCTPGRCKPEM